jgi:hypothetical protein
MIRDGEFLQSRVSGKFASWCQTNPLPAIRWKSKLRHSKKTLCRYRCEEPPGNSAPTSNPKRDSSRFCRL